MFVLIALRDILYYYGTI